MTSTRPRRRRGRLAWVVAAAALALVFGLSPWGRSVDHIALDSLFFAQGTKAAAPEVVIVGIDEASFAELGLQWPWPRSVHARLVDTLFAAGARAVGFDVLFAEASNPEDDGRLAESIREHPRLVLATDQTVVRDPTYVQRIDVQPWNELVTDETVLGFVNLPVDSDGFVRRVTLRRDHQEALSLAVAARGIDRTCCTDQGSAMTINFAGPPRTMRTVSYYQALEPSTYLPPGIFANKLVLVGVVSQAATVPDARSPDHFAVPFSRWGHGYMPGVEIHANIVANLLHKDSIQELSRMSVLLGGFPAALLSGLLFLRLRPLPGAVVLAVQLLAFSVIAVVLFSGYQVFVPPVLFVLPLVAAYLVSPSLLYYRTRQEKRFIETAFSTYLAPSVVKQLIDNPASLQPGGRSVEASVMFLDVSGFTTLSERVTPTVLVDVMNRLLGEVTTVVMDHGGMIDKFIGDAVMAVWGAPVSRLDHADCACRAALEVQQRVADVAAREARVTGASLTVRIGVNSGVMIAGNIGGSRRFDYTVMGDNVNLASRLEGVNKTYGTRILIGENTAALAGETFGLREIDDVRVKGRRQPVRIFELQQIGAATQRDHERRRDASFERGRRHYLRQEWDEALAAFNVALAEDSNDGPSRVYTDRCRFYRQRPPDAEWDRVFEITTK